MIIVKHKVNTVEELKEIDSKYGIEIDVRDNGKQLILNHDAFEDGEILEDFLRVYNNRLLVLNIKCEGIEDSVIKLVRQYKVKDYFLSDVSFHVIINSKLKKASIRFSEFESIKTCMKLIGLVDWVLVDNFTGLPSWGFNELRKHFKLCVISPELFGRKQDIEMTRKIFKKNEVDAVMVDNCSLWEK